MSSTTAVSFEVYPPRRPYLMGPLQDSIRALEGVGPEFISVTYGAGGSSTRNSLEVLGFIRDHTESTPLAHLTCVGTRRDEAEDLLHDFVTEGITHFLALRGDLPDGSTTHQGELPHAADLVSLMAENRSRPGGPEVIAVAAFPNGHPESNHVDQDIQALLAKQEAGADFAITQLFFYTDHYLTFVERARSAGVTLPLLPGLMPITSPQRLHRVLELTGEQSPSELADALAATNDPASWEDIGISWTAQMVEELVDAGANGVHLYAFNQHRQVLEVLRRSGVRP